MIEKTFLIFKHDQRLYKKTHSNFINVEVKDNVELLLSIYDNVVIKRRVDSLKRRAKAKFYLS